MKLRAAFLCDAASVRENLLHVLGAGLTHFRRPELPAPALFMYAALVEASEGDAGRQVELRITIHGPPGDGEGEEELVFEHPVTATVDSYDDLGQSAQPLVLDLHTMPLVRYGTYVVRTYIDNVVVDEIRTRCEP